jgi:hypothetical protein
MRIAYAFFASVAMLSAATVSGSGGACATGTLQDYVDLGSTGCTMSASGLRLFDFTYSESGTSVIAADVVAFIYGDTSDAIAIGIGNIDGTSLWAASNGAGFTLEITWDWEAALQLRGHGSFVGINSLAHPCSLSVTINASTSATCPPTHGTGFSAEADGTHDVRLVIGSTGLGGSIGVSIINNSWFLSLRTYQSLPLCYWYQWHWER